MCIMSCDFMKCFDRVETECVIKGMEFFNIRVQNYGYMSDPIITTRSLHQGGPASNAYFLVVTELLANAIRNDTEIGGVFVKEVLMVLNQYADDLDLFLKWNQKVFDRVIHQFDTFQKSTGFQLSYEKTTMYRVGSLERSNAQMYTGKPMRWTSDSINVLGVDITSNEDNVVEMNYQKTMTKVCSVIDQWKRRNLSLIGRVNIVNTLIASLFVYNMSVLPTISDKYLKMSNEKIKDFLWNGHRQKIPLDILQSSKEKAGAGLVHLDIKDKSLKMSWVRMLMDGMYSEKLAYNILQPDLQRNIWICNLHRKDISALRCNNKFWNDVIAAWTEYHYTPIKPDVPSAQCLWLNSNIRVQNKPVMFKNALRKGLMFVYQLFEDGDWISHERAKSLYALDVLEYNSLKAAIPKEYKEAGRLDMPFTDEKFAMYMQTERPAHFAYQHLLPVSNKIEKREEQWTLDLGEQICMEECVSEIKYTTKVMKYQSFQYRLLMRAVITNVNLKRWGISESDACSMCSLPEKETYRHLFYECSEIQKLFRQIKTICDRCRLGKVTFTYTNVITNQIHCNQKSVVNFMCLIAKQFVYAKRCLKQKVNANEFERVVYLNKNIEKYQAVKDNKIRTVYVTMGDERNIHRADRHPVRLMSTLTKWEMNIVES